jgi:hypothetical protein
VKTTYSVIQWLGLVARSESEQAHEWPAIMSVVLNRVKAPLWPDDVPSVVLEALQFSGFNETYGDPDDRYRQVAGKYPSNQLFQATSCAVWILGTAPIRRPVPESCFWFYSPRSMVPVGKVPGWAKDKRFTVVPGVDSWRFLFLE